MPLTTDDLRVVIHDHIVNKCPIEVWDREYKARTHLTTADVDEVNTPKEIMSIFQIKYIPGTTRPMFTSVEQYRNEQITEGAYFKGKPQVKSIMRVSKKKDKVSKNVIREFYIGHILPDHHMVVTTDPTDSQVISMEYVYRENEFLKEAQEKLKARGLQYEH